MKTYTKGSVIVEDIKVGDIHYEYEYNMGVKCEVITLPTLNKDGQYEWQSRNVNNDKIINYLVDPNHSHYGPNLYDYEAYQVSRYI